MYIEGNIRLMEVVDSEFFCDEGFGFWLSIYFVFFLIIFELYVI